MQQQPPDAALQADEREALQAIYATSLTLQSPNTLVLSVPLHLPSPLHLALPRAVFLPSRVAHLPPPVLTVAFPPDYPSVSPPRLHLSVPYAPLPLLDRLLRHLDALFCPGVPVVFDWATAVSHFVLDRLILATDIAPVRYELHLTNDHPPVNLDKRILRPCTPASEIAAAVRDYAANAERRRLDAAVFKCPVCWEHKPGKLCVSLAACLHVTCAECLAAFWESRIVDGRVSTADIVCPRAECGAEASPAEVREVVAKDVYDKYERFLLNAVLEGDGEMMRCPREGCVQMAAVDTDDASMGRCAYCLYVFCIECKRKWHAPLGCEEAAPKGEEEDDVGAIVERLQGATEEEREQIRASLGAAAWDKVETAVAMCEMGGRVCAQCGIYVVKNGGCAHMTCKCGFEFCWTCGEEFRRGHYRPGNCRLYDNREMQAVHEQIYNWIYE